MLLTKSVKMKIINFNKEFYKNKGYGCEIGDVINVLTWDVSKSSHIRVTVLCDNCKKQTKDVSINSLNQSYKNGDYICDDCKNKLLNSRKCEVCGSTHNVTDYLNQGQLLCQRHQRMLREHGYIRRTVHDINEIRIFNDYLEFDTYDRKGNVSGTFSADLDMVNFIRNNKLHRHKDGYACYKFKDEYGEIKNMRFHRYVMEVHKEKEDKSIIDHIDRDKSNNRKENLRIASSKDNIVNTGMLSTNTSGHKGISWDKRKEMWEAYIHKNNKKISLGMYSDFDKAVKVREIAEIIYFGNNNPNYGYLINKYINEPQVQRLLKGECNNDETN